MEFSNGYLVATSVVLSMMSSLWVCSLVTKDASVIDRFWGFGFVLIACVLGLVSPTTLAWNQALLIFIVAVWGLRLSIYIHLRNRGNPEDYRYQEMRRHHGQRFWWYSFFSVFLLQGLIMLIVACPVIYVIGQTSPDDFGMATIFGALLWLTGFVFEAGGDWQLSRFKKDPKNKGQILKTGLWALTRHPNYFGDACQWWGFGLFAFAYLPWGILTFVGPIVMTLFIRKVSGVDLLEKSLKTSKPGYAEYIANVPAFVPRLNFWKAFVFVCLLPLYNPDALSQIIPELKPEQDTPYSRIDFQVFDLKTHAPLASGDEKIQREESLLTKTTTYYSNAKTLQSERSVVDLKSLEVREYQFENKVTGERVHFEMPQGPVARVAYLQKPDAQVKNTTYDWHKNSFIGKTLHHLIARHWNQLIQDEPVNFELFVPMKSTHYLFRVRREKSYKQLNANSIEETLHVIALEPQNWAFRTLAPRMEFHYSVVDQIPLLRHYEGITTVAIDGDENRKVAIDFTYLKNTK